MECHIQCCENADCFPNLWIAIHEVVCPVPAKSDDQCVDLVSHKLTILSYDDEGRVEEAISVQTLFYYLLVTVVLNSSWKTFVSGG